MTARGAWVGLDVGTTSSKAVAYDEAGAPIGTGRARTVWRTTDQGVETDADALLQQALTALDEAVRRLPDGTRVLGIGVTSMGETGVLVDRAGRPCGPSIAWHDARDDVEVEALRRDLGEEAFGARAGKPLRGQFSLTKHRWLRQHQAGAAEAVRRFNVAEWVVRGLSGAEVCDRSLAGRTGWFDLAAGDWWDEALSWSGATRELMPALVDAGEAVGRVRSGHPQLHGAVVTTAGHDHQAAAVGAGAVGTGDELDSCGTAEALVRTVRPDLTPEQVLALARGGITTDVSVQPGRWSLLGGTEGGLAMERTLERLGVGRDGLAALDRAALALPGDHCDRGAADGADGANGADSADGADEEDPARTWRSAVEAATAEAVALHEAMTAVAGPHARLVAAGGWCNSAMVVDAKRRAFGPLEVSTVAEAGTRGAATLAARAAGALVGDEVLPRA